MPIIDAERKQATIPPATSNPILVTGGAGYIGSCPLIPAYLPIAFDNLVYGHRDLVKWGPFEEGDIADSTRLDGVMEKYQPDAVLHFAGFAYVGESVQKPDKYYRNNVVGSLTLLESMIKHRMHKIVFSSTCSTYGDNITAKRPGDGIFPCVGMKSRGQVAQRDYEKDDLI